MSGGSPEAGACKTEQEATREMVAVRGQRKALTVIAAEMRAKG
jgi:hypothetical protein